MAPSLPSTAKFSFFLQLTPLVSLNPISHFLPLSIPVFHMLFPSLTEVFANACTQPVASWEMDTLRLIGLLPLQLGTGLPCTHVAFISAGGSLGSSQSNLDFYSQVKSCLAWEILQIGLCFPLVPLPPDFF